MLLNIYCDIAPDDWLKIKVNGETKTLARNGDAIPVVSFHPDDKKQYEIEVEQELTASNRTPLWILFYVVTIAIQGLFNVFLLNTDSDWYNNIKAYRLRAKLLVDVRQDIDVRLTFRNAIYDKSVNKWSPPCFKAEPEVVASADFVANHHDFGNQYFNYVKKIVSALVLAVLVVGVLLYFAVTHSKTAAAIATSVVIAGLVIVVAAACISQHKQFQRVYNGFLSSR